MHMQMSNASGVSNTQHAGSGGPKSKNPNRPLLCWLLASPHSPHCLRLRIKCEYEIGGKNGTQSVSGTCGNIDCEPRNSKGHIVLFPDGEVQPLRYLSLLPSCFGDWVRGAQTDSGRRVARRDSGVSGTTDTFGGVIFPMTSYSVVKKRIEHTELLVGRKRASTGEGLHTNWR